MDMNRFAHLNDQYIYGLVDTREPDIVAECEICSAEIYEGQEAYYDGYSCLCSKECALEYYIIREVFLHEEGHSCENCCIELQPDYETFADGEDNLFCSEECALQYHELELTEMEGKRYDY